MPKEQSSIIKVIGVGGGGCNAVNHMFNQGIKDVNFVICNTDGQALDISPVPNKIQLGPDLTKGRGAGSHPSTGKEATMESMKEVKEVLEKNTEMVFVTAGMGGGTGTGGGPVIAKTAKDLGILTIGIVTMPFGFEGKRRRQQAEEGLAEMRKNVDAILIISNDKLREIYGNLEFNAAFAKADDILATAAKGIAEIITVPGYVNVDFEDVKTVLRNSGLAIMGSARANGENRAMEAVKGALASPLLNDSDISGAKNILLNISSGTKPVLMDEISEITEFVQEAAGNDCDIIWGNCNDELLGDDILVTLIATGFETEKERRVKMQKETVVKVFLDPVEKKTQFEDISNQDNEQPDDKMPEMEIKLVNPLKPEDIRPVDSSPVSESDVKRNAQNNDQSPRQFTFEFNGSLFDFSNEESELENDAPINILQQDSGDDEHSEPEALRFIVRNELKDDQTDEDLPEVRMPEKRELERPNLADNKDRMKMISQHESERVKRLKSLSLRLNNLDELEKTPAYMRRNIQLEDTPDSSQTNLSNYSLNERDGNGLQIRRNNTFLHDNVD